MIVFENDIKFQNVQDPPRASPAQGGEKEATRSHPQSFVWAESELKFF